MTVWNAYDEDWICCIPQACPMESGVMNCYFENESEPVEALIGWLPLPGL
jgi:hypothetical protein